MLGAERFRGHRGPGPSLWHPQEGADKTGQAAQRAAVKDNGQSIVPESQVPEVGMRLA